MARIAKLRAQRKGQVKREKALTEKRRARQDKLLKLQVTYASLQQDELLLARRAEPNARTVRETLAKKRKTIAREEFSLRADLVTLTKAIDQARATTTKTDSAIANAVKIKISLLEEIGNCEQRCVVSSLPGTLALTASSLADVAQSNRTAIRQAARSSAACRSCGRLENQITAVGRRINERREAETALRSQMTRLDRQRQAIRNEWRTLYDRYADRLLVRLEAGRNESNEQTRDARLDAIAKDIVAVNGRWQRLLTREGQLQDQLMTTGRERDQLSNERRRLRAGLGACQELCLSGERDPANAGLRLASQRINLAPATADCPRCQSLAALVNAVTAELGTAQQARDDLAARFARVEPALEQIQERRRSIIRYAGELADLMDDFRESGDVARAKRELTQMSERSQRLSSDIINILDQREQLERRIDTNADQITRLSILARQRRRELAACEERCKASDGQQVATIERPDLTFATPRPTTVGCERCASHARIIDQFRRLKIAEQAGLTVATATLQLANNRLGTVERALQANADAIRRARALRDRSASERRTLVEGLTSEGSTIRTQRASLRTRVTAAERAREAVVARIAALDVQIGTARDALTACQASCRVVAKAPASSIRDANALLAQAGDIKQSCAKCEDRRAVVTTGARELRADVRRLETALRSQERRARALTDLAPRVEENREALVSGARRWFDQTDDARRTARARTVRADGVRASRLARTLGEAATAYRRIATTRDDANAAIAGKLTSLQTALDAYARCAETCDEQNLETESFDVSEFSEQNPASLIVQPTTPTAVRARCTECSTKADDVNRLARERASAVARIATARNTTRSANRLKQRIAQAERDITSRVTTLTQRRFNASGNAERNEIRRAIATLQGRTEALARVRNRQDARLETATRNIDAARQDLRRLSRALSDARRELSTCDASCAVAENSAPDATDETAEPPASRTADAGDKAKDRLPGVDGAGDGGKRAEDAPKKTAEVSTRCRRCNVFSKRITALEAERKSKAAERDGAIATRARLIKTVREAVSQSRDTTRLIREQRKLTRIIEVRTAAVDRLTARLTRLRASLKRCAQVCEAPGGEGEGSPEIADAGGIPDAAPDTQAPARDTASAPPADLDNIEPHTPRAAKQPRRTAPRRRAAIDPPVRKTETVEVDDSTMLPDMPRVFGALSNLMTGGWETSVEVEAGGGNVWAPETARLTVTDARDRKLTSTTFAATLHARQFTNGGADVAWGTIEVTRADDNRATGDTDYSRIAGVVGVGHEMYGCLDGAARCAIGLKAGIEHMSLDADARNLLTTQDTSIDSTAALLGLWSEIAVPLTTLGSNDEIGAEMGGLALVLKADAHAKAGRASADVNTTTMGATRNAAISETFIGFGASAAAELEWSFGQGAIAFGGKAAIDSMPALDLSIAADPKLQNDSVTSTTIYVRGSLKF
ncbi:MAG: hypothetical protein AAGJ70_01440 [Pseudomonadota bacterium]